MKTKKLLSLFLVLALALSLLPAVTASAEEAGAVPPPAVLDHAAEYIPDHFSPLPVFPQATDEQGNVKLKPTNEVRWIDRLDLTGADYAMEFYQWLVENSDGDGTEDALIDPTGAAANGSDGYVHVGDGPAVTLDFSYESGEDPEHAASLAVSYVSESLTQELFQLIAATYYAFDRDHPEVFWLGGSIRYGSSRRITDVTADPATGTGTVTITFTIYFYLTSANNAFDIRSEDYRSPDAIYDTIAVREEHISAILAEVDPDASRYRQVQTLNHWLTTHNAYNSSDDLSVSSIGREPRECICALEGQTGPEGPVCESYARAFKVLCDRLDIPCVLVDGANHMWNYTQMENGNWYAVDVTWNDPLSGTEAVSGYEHEEFLLVGSSTVIRGDTFISEHPVENTPSANQTLRFPNGPVLSETAFDPNAPTTHTHSYGDPVFYWSSDYSACSVSIICSGCAEGAEGHSLSAPCTISTTTSADALTVTAAALLNGSVVSDSKIIRAELSEDTVTITLPMTSGALYVLVVSYDSDGRMIDCRMEPTTAATMEAALSGTRTVVYFPDKEEYAPKLDAWTVR